MFRFFESLKDRPDTIEEAMKLAAYEFVRVLHSSGNEDYANRLDHSEASLQAVDEWLHQFYERKWALDSNRQFLCAAYIFEIARARFGGRYLSYNSANPYLLVISSGEFDVGFCAIEKVMMRTLNKPMNGTADSIPFFYEGIAPAIARKTNAILI